MSLVHGSWTIGTLVHRGPTSIVGRWSSSEFGLWPLRGSRPMTKGRRGGSGARETRWAAHPSSGGSETAARRRRMVVAKGLRWGCAPVRERRQGGRCGGEVRRGATQLGHSFIGVEGRRRQPGRASSDGNEHLQWCHYQSEEGEEMRPS
jgi:hypothetical protein